MANRFFSPNQQFADNTGLPYAGGSLTFYASGTSTPLATYSNRALTIPNTNPIVLDSAGRAGDIFLQNLAYKVVLASDALGLVPVWTADPVYSSDFSTTASFLSGAGSPNGVVAGSAGSATVPASVYWDTTNNILYVCTTTGTAATAVWTAVNASTAASVVPAPQGYLTPSSGVPIIPSDVVSATSIFYTPYVGNLVPIYNGSSFNPTVFSELQLTLVAAHAASNIYDVFVFNNSGVPTVVTGPSWSAGTGGSITPGSSVRGTGAGGTSLSRINGLNTNAVQITGRNGSTTFTINANLATYVGTIFMDTTNGQVTCHRSVGQSRKWGIWNAFNRATITLSVTDPTANWNNVSASIRQSNGGATNTLTVLQGLTEEIMDCQFSQTMQLTPNIASSLTQFVTNGIGINATTGFTGMTGIVGANSNNSSPSATSTVVGTATAKTSQMAGLGLTSVNACEQGNSGGSVVVLFLGTTAHMLLTTTWRG